MNRIHILLVIMLPILCSCHSTDSVSDNENATVTEFPSSYEAFAIEDTCNDLYRSSSKFIKGKDNQQPPTLKKPKKGTTYIDPIYGTCIVKATEHAKEPPVGFARNDYSRRPAFNADNTRFIVYSNNGFWHLYNAKTLQYISTLNGPAADAEPQWHPDAANLLYYLPNTGGMAIFQYDINTEVSKTVADFNGRLPWPNTARLWTRSEGSPSADGRYWGFLAETQDYKPLGLVIYDLVNDEIINTWDIDSESVGRPDHVSMSPSGEYIIGSWDGSLGTVAFDHKFSKQIKLHHKSEHSDLALLKNSNDAYISVDFQSNLGDVFMVELQTGRKTVLFSTYIDGTASAIHFSGKAYDKPGWVLVSTYGPYIPEGKTKQWLHNKIFALSLEKDPSIINIAHHRANTLTYFGEPHASVNRNFTRILTNSNWESDKELDVDAYMILLPDNFL